MDFRLSDEQAALRDGVRTLLTRECSPALARERYTDPAATADGLWRRFADGGWLGVAVAEEHGGLGMGAVGLALLLEEAGRALAPVPLLETAAVAASLTTDPELLASIAAGGVRATGALEPAAGDTAQLVPEAHVADVVLVPADGKLLALRSADVRVHESLDRTRILCDVPLVGAEVVAGAPDVGAALLPATVGLAAELVGVARWLLETTVAYVGVREQFGVPVGTFQAVQHACADVLVDVERASAAVYWAAMCLDAGAPDGPRATAIAKASAGDAARHAARTAVQLHGGIGYTWEHDLHLYVRRVYGSEPLLGGSEDHRRTLADLLPH